MAFFRHCASLSSTCHLSGMSFKKIEIKRGQKRVRYLAKMKYLWQHFPFPISGGHPVWTRRVVYIQWNILGGDLYIPDDLLLFGSVCGDTFWMCCLSVCLSVYMFVCVSTILNSLCSSSSFPIKFYHFLNLFCCYCIFPLILFNLRRYLCTEKK
jgi:hypothetical protein